VEIACPHVVTPNSGYEDKAVRVLVTGSSGFVGHHLTAYLAQADYEAWGIDQNPLDDPEIRSRFFLSELSDVDEIIHIIKQVQPTHLVHLAGVLGDATYEALYRVNVLGTIHLLEALRRAGSTARVLIASSSAVYGANPPEQNPLGEGCPPCPISHYGVSKLAQENVGRQYYHAYQMPILIARTFNLVGPGMSPALLASSLARQIAKVELGQSSRPILVGNLWPRRDYVDVRDAVKAYVALVTAGQPGLVYNVCTGHSSSVQNCLEVLLNLARQPVQVKQDPRRMRSEEIADQAGDPARLHEATGWEPTIPFEKSLTDLLDSWRAVLAKEKSS
jgi:GDP-4-dehydro-6-deoxy-D-mannose reductase